MNSLDSNKRKCQVVLSAPIGECCVKSCQNGTKAVHPGISSFNNPLVFIKLHIKYYSFVLSYRFLD